MQRYTDSLSHGALRERVDGGSCQLKMAAPLTLVLILAVSIRAVLFRSSLATLISERVEVVSPLNSWKRGMLRFQ